MKQKKCDLRAFRQIEALHSFSSHGGNRNRDKILKYVLLKLYGRFIGRSNVREFVKDGSTRLKFQADNDHVDDDCTLVM